MTNPLESIEGGVSKQLTSEQFESLEPTRTAKQIKRSADNRTVQSSISQPSAMSFDKKVQELSAKYGKPGENEPSMLVRLHAAAIKI